MRGQPQVFGFQGNISKIGKKNLCSTPSSTLTFVNLHVVLVSSQTLDLNARRKMLLLEFTLLMMSTIC